MCESNESSPSSPTGNLSREESSGHLSVGGLSWEDISCDESDDISPKTDYTYARTASYSPRYFHKKRCLSPNMSRRKIRGHNPSFLSDDEDFEDPTESVLSSVSQAQDIGFPFQSPPPPSEVRGRRRDRHSMVTSTPLMPHEEHHISTHDHYYKGMLLRLGSHKRYRDSLRARRSEGSGLRPTMDLDSAGNSTITTITTTTTTTTTSMEEERRREKERLALEEDELKLKLDQSQTEKDYVDNVYHLEHFDGLDSDDDISDVDDTHLLAGTSHKGETVHQRQHDWSVITWLTTVVTTIVTTIVSTVTTTTTTLTDAVTGSGSQSVLASVARVVSAPILVPSRWAWRAVVSTCTWLVTQSATLLLMEIDMKQRRRRGCCCCLLPLLLLLPLALLAGYYSQNLHQETATYLARSRNVLSSSWAYLWLASDSKDPPVHQPPVIVPSDSKQEVHHHHHHEVNMAELHEYIQQAIIQQQSVSSSQQQQQQHPEGLTEQQVRILVAAMLADRDTGLREGWDANMVAFKGILQKDLDSLQGDMSVLQAEINAASLSHQTMADNLEKTKLNFEGASSTQKQEWLLNSQSLEVKLQSLESKLQGMQAETEALTGLITSCCQNNSVLAAAIRDQVMAAMAQFGVDEDDPTWSRLLAALGGQYVERSELDRRLDAASAEIIEKLKVLLASQREEERASVEMQGTVVAGIDELAVKSIVDEALSQFSADGIGLPDFALESAGGSVLSVRCSETYYRKTALVSVFGIPLWYTSNSPRTVIQPNVHPGECWAFKGQAGYVVIQLSYPVQPSGFTLEHIPRRLSPQGRIDSAPKEFAVIGLLHETDTQGVSLGNYTYEDNGRPVQYFPIQNSHPGVFQLVELRVLNNHGNREYTCLYRFRVHGML